MRLIEEEIATFFSVSAVNIIDNVANTFSSSSFFLLRQIHATEWPEGMQHDEGSGSLYMLESGFEQMLKNYIMKVRLLS